MGYFAVLDTETNWVDRVMSIGTVIADADSFCMVDAKYHVLEPEYTIGGMYENTLFIDRDNPPEICSREKALSDLADWFAGYGVRALFAYNAAFDRNHLPEFSGYSWFDIMRLAAYRQYNHKLPECWDYCSTGRLKRGYGVEPMLRLLSDRSGYRESHNAVYDAMDELEIMRQLGHPLSAYIPLEKKL